ncbi:restriction endonuclease [Kineococcus sp. SYSU DK002]|uniref:restriction endonuclease n=1 Tax=Kineococcus sp. SYSU DK002 TaxID=3383123 RepID=UPI003D7DEB4A
MGWRDWFGSTNHQNSLPPMRPTFPPSVQQSVRSTFDGAELGTAIAAVHGLTGDAWKKAQAAYIGGLASADSSLSQQVDALLAVVTTWSLVGKTSSKVTSVAPNLGQVIERVASSLVRPDERLLAFYPTDGDTAEVLIIAVSQGYIIRQEGNTFRLGPPALRATVGSGVLDLGRGQSITLTELPYALAIAAAAGAQQMPVSRGSSKPYFRQAKRRTDKPKRSPRPRSKSDASATAIHSAVATTVDFVNVPPVEIVPMAVRPRPAHRFIRTYRDAEEVAAEWMEYMGYTGVQVTELGPDGGIDIVADGAVAQVKLHGKPMGRPPLQQLRGASRDGDALLFFSASGYTAQGREWADTVGMALFTFDRQGEPEPVNEVAQELFHANDQ